ncbi:hypothetical protein LTR95_007465 [Oleoguttula sp. CCFEE 5521]
MPRANSWQQGHRPPTRAAAQATKKPHKDLPQTEEEEEWETYLLVTNPHTDRNDNDDEESDEKPLLTAIRPVKHKAVGSGDASPLYEAQSFRWASDDTMDDIPTLSTRKRSKQSRVMKPSAFLQARADHKKATRPCTGDVGLANVAAVMTTLSDFDRVLAVVLPAEIDASDTLDRLMVVKRACDALHWSNVALGRHSILPGTVDKFLSMPRPREVAMHVSPNKTLIFALPHYVNTPFTLLNRIALGRLHLRDWGQTVIRVKTSAKIFVAVSWRDLGTRQISIEPALITNLEHSKINIFDNVSEVDPSRTVPSPPNGTRYEKPDNSTQTTPPVTPSPKLDARATAQHGAAIRFLGWLGPEMAENVWENESAFGGWLNAVTLLYLGR